MTLWSCPFSFLDTKYIFYVFEFLDKYKKYICFSCVLNVGAVVWIDVKDYVNRDSKRMVYMMKDLVFFVLGFVFFGLPIYGFQVDFPKDTFDVDGSGMTRSLLVMNKGRDLLAVEISIATRDIAVDGQETLGEPSMDFDIYPTQLLINPGEDANVTLVWKGAMKVDRELAYRVTTKEIPFNDSTIFKTGSVQLLVGRRFLHAAYVTPPNVKPNIRIQSLIPSENEGVASLVVMIENVGTAHKIVSGFAVNVTHRVIGGKLVPLARSIEIRDPSFSKKFNLLPGGALRFVVPWPDSLSPGAVLHGEILDVR